MLRKVLPVVAALLGIAASTDASAQPRTGLPVHVVVSGEGPPIRVQIFQTPSPTICNLSARPLLDAMVEVGQTASVVSSTPCVCYRHTNGVLRRVDFGNAQTVCWPRRFNDDPYLRIDIRAERPR
jgi:hypothetical protein